MGPVSLRLQGGEPPEAEGVGWRRGRNPIPNISSCSARLFSNGQIPAYALAYVFERAPDPTERLEILLRQLHE